ncbi:response regulator transcription factor [Chitinophaga pendula]|uniref:LytR/AlgR family response regulator transcription factor n=1 Tax=Chitinophaga TaxID=79328 RepID=UPI000BAFB112|nr:MULTISPECIES: response regulator transcription factor [Chitinophaga]ASZ12474.1 DNA-binding response regulator [Chitinophaga sp. MD30]UCJ09926.1 response regulator transcription factor [Chitinophaga pendula]
MKIKCLITDDEPLAIALLQNHISQLPTLEVVGTCANALQAAQELRTKQVDLLFLDIKMPQITGIEFLKTLRQPPAVIFTTAYREYALEGYELDIVDYLLKPITFERFFKAVERYYSRFSLTKTQIILPPAIPTEEYIFIKTGNKYNKIPASDICYMESVKDYMVIHRTDGSTFMAKYKISDMEEEVRNKRFLRIHRSFIVNLDRVTAFTLQDVEIAGKELPVGNSYREFVFKILKEGL